MRRGLRRRESQARCPELYVAMADPERDARLFEPVAAAIDAVAPGVEVLRPGLLVLSARGVSRYFGSEEAAAERLVDQASAAGVESQVGVADQLSTAVIAARRAALVPPGEGARFLGAATHAGVGGRAQSVCAASRGVGGSACAGSGSEPSVLSRIYRQWTSLRVSGPMPVLAHRAARGEPERPPSARTLPPDLEVEQHYDPSIERVDAAAFAGRALASLPARQIVGCRSGVHPPVDFGQHGQR